MNKIQRKVFNQAVQNALSCKPVFIMRLLDIDKEAEAAFELGGFDGLEAALPAIVDRYALEVKR